MRAAGIDKAVAVSLSTLHYTDVDSFKAINSQVTWCFEAGQPPANHPFGAYFTDLGANTPNLAKRLRIPKVKLEYLFGFVGTDGLIPLPGGRGEHIFYCPVDYYVTTDRQDYAGPASDAPETCQ
jgi:hypothetical protein